MESHVVVIRPNRGLLFVAVLAFVLATAALIEPGWRSSLDSLWLRGAFFGSLGLFGLYFTSDVVVTADVTVIRTMARQHVYATDDVLRMTDSGRPGWTSAPVIWLDGRRVPLGMPLTASFLHAVVREVRGGAPANDRTEPPFHGRIRSRSSVMSSSVRLSESGRKRGE